MGDHWRLWAIWVGIILTASAVLHGYLWRRFFYDTKLSPKLARFFAGLFVVYTFSIPLMFWWRRHFAEPLDSLSYLVMITWLACVYFLVCIRFILGVVPAGLKLKTILSRDRSFDPDRRKFLSRALAAGTLSVGAPAIAYGAFKALDDPELREVEVKLEKLPPALHGFTLVQLTDLHVAVWTSDQFVERLVERSNAIRPDAVMLTGDLIDADVDQIISKMSALGRLKTRYGVYMVTGNHEYYIGLRRWIPAFEKFGINCLSNEGRTIAGGVYVAGIPDRTAHRIVGADVPDLPRAMARRPPDLPALLLAHQPRDIHAAESAGVDLQLSGHTHGGQVWPFGSLMMAVQAQPYLSGLHRHGRAQIYVSRGAGTWGPPIRIAAPAEITKIVLI